MKHYKTILFSLVFVANMGSFAQAQSQQGGYTCAAPKLDTNSHVTEIFWAWVTTLTVNSDSQNMGEIKKRFWSITKKFDWYDPSGQLIAEARQDIISWGTRIVVTDCQGKTIGSLEEHVFNSFLEMGVFNKYSIKDANGNEVATSEKVQAFSTNIDIRDTNNQVIANLNRPFINFFTDKWTMHLYGQTSVDPRLMIMIAAYKTDSDNHKRASAAASSSRSYSRRR